MLHLTVVRHGSTAWNESGRYQGWSDPPLSERGRSEAAMLGERLAEERFDLVMASDLLRARETADIVVPSAPLHTDPRLRELNFGAWEGLTWDECTQRDGDHLQRWMRDPAAHTPPEGEDTPTFEARVASAVDELPSEGKVLVATHSGVIRVLLARWLGVTLRQTSALKLSHCGIMRAELFTGGARILCVNDTGHILPAPSGPQAREP